MRRLRNRRQADLLNTIARETQNQCNTCHQSTIQTIQLAMIQSTIQTIQLAMITSKIQTIQLAVVLSKIQNIQLAMIPVTKFEPSNLQPIYCAFAKPESFAVRISALAKPEMTSSTCSFRIATISLQLLIAHMQVSSANSFSIWKQFECILQC